MISMQVVVCPYCGKTAAAPEELLGRTTICKVCGKSFVLQAPQASSPPEVRPVAPPAAPPLQPPPEPRPAPAFRRTHVAADRGALVLTLGVIGFFVAPVLGPVAWVLGYQDLKKMDQGLMSEEGRVPTQIGYALGLVTSILWILVILACAGVMAFVLMLGGASGRFERQRDEFRQRRPRQEMRQPAAAPRADLTPVGASTV